MFVANFSKWTSQDSRGSRNSFFNISETLNIHGLVYISVATAHSFLYAVVWRKLAARASRSSCRRRSKQELHRLFELFFKLLGTLRCCSEYSLRGFDKVQRPHFRTSVADVLIFMHSLHTLPHFNSHCVCEKLCDVNDWPHRPLQVFLSIFTPPLDVHFLHT